MIHSDCQQNSTKRGRSNSGSLLLSSTISLKTKQVMLITYNIYMFYVYVSMQTCQKWHYFCYRWIRTNGFFEQLTGLASPWTLGSLALCQGWYLLRLQKPQWTSPLLHAKECASQAHSTDSEISSVSENSWRIYNHVGVSENRGFSPQIIHL